MTQISLIGAMGKSRQIGLHGKLPWHQPDDLKLFRQATEGCVVVVGYRTWPSVMHLDGTLGRVFLIDGASTYIDQQMMPWSLTIAERVARYHRARTIWIAGGAKTYTKYAPLCDPNTSIVTHIDYDGPADAFMPPLPWEAVQPVVEHAT